MSRFFRAVLGTVVLSLTAAGCDQLWGEDYLHWAGTYSLTFVDSVPGQSCAFGMTMTLERSGSNKRAGLQGNGNCTANPAFYVFPTTFTDVRFSGSATAPSISFDFVNCRFTGTGR